MTYGHSTSGYWEFAPFGDGGRENGGKKKTAGRKNWREEGKRREEKKRQEEKIGGKKETDGTIHRLEIFN